MKRSRISGGYTLIELVVAVGLFAIVMTLATGAYLIMISANRQTQGLVTGIDNLTFALEDMTTAMRTGTNYACGGTGGDCPPPGGGSSFSFIDQEGRAIVYSLSSDTNVCGVQVTGLAGCVVETVDGGPLIPLTAPAIGVATLTFYVSGTTPESAGDSMHMQPYVTIIVAGTVTVGPGKTQSFSVESSAAMRGSDL